MYQGNHYCSRDFGGSAANNNAYHYSNKDGSYYYSNSNVSLLKQIYRKDANIARVQPTTMMELERRRTLPQAANKVSISTSSIGETRV